MTYGELDLKIRSLARGFRELGVKKGDIVASDAPNVAENVILQLALSHLGAGFATAKDVDMLQGKVGPVVSVVPSSEDSWLASLATPLPAVRLDTATGQDGYVSYTELSGQEPDGEDAAATPECLLGNYNGAAMSQAQALALGNDAAQMMHSNEQDRTCVSITLCHSFGLGSGVGSAFVSGGAVVLPAAGGIRGCGDPKQRATVTHEVLQSTGSTLLFADTHILKQLPASSGMVLRGGIVKIGSGTDIFDDGSGMEYAGAALFAMGKRPAA